MCHFFLTIFSSFRIAPLHTTQREPQSTAQVYGYTTPSKCICTCMDGCNIQSLHKFTSSCLPLDVVSSPLLQLWYCKTVRRCWLLCLLPQSRTHSQVRAADRSIGLRLHHAVKMETHIHGWVHCEVPHEMHFLSVCRCGTRLSVAAVLLLRCNAMLAALSVVRISSPVHGRWYRCCSCCPAVSIEP